MRKELCIVVFLFSLVSASWANEDPYPFDKESTVIGSTKTYKIKKNESLIEIARRFNIGYNEIMDANRGLNPFVPGTDIVLRIPTAWAIPDVPSHEGIVINLSEMRLYYFSKKNGSSVVRTFPIGIGDEGNETPLGAFTIIEKTANPSWRPPASIRKERPELPAVVPPGPDNPLGTHALRLSIGTVLVHGTNRPYAVGRRVTHGCIRLYPEDIPKLFELVPKGTKVSIIRQPVKVGTRNGTIYVEVHKDDDDKERDYLGEAVHLLRKKNLLKTVSTAKLYHAVSQKTGIPAEVSD